MTGREHNLDGEPPFGDRAWLVTFTDLISLMLTFMVMLFATSTVDSVPWRKTVDTLAETLNWPDRDLPKAEARASVDRARIIPALQLGYLSMVLKTTLAEDPSFAGVGIDWRGNRLVISIPDTLLFAPGTANVSDRARRMLTGMVPALRGISNRLGIDGHTDPRPVQPGGMFPSNWELSLARALAVSNVLAQAGLERPVTCYGLADTRYDELGDMPESARRQAARRVDLVVFAGAGDEM
jgi:chemotaxis protein MotB